MFSRVSHHQQHLPHSPQSPYSSNYRATRDPSSAFPANSSQASQRNTAQNASFRQRSERLQQYARPVRSTVPLPQQLAPHASYTSAPEASEHMLRRKTPNGTLAAGYDGSPVEWTKRPHAMKHVVMLTSNDNRKTAYVSTLGNEFDEQLPAHEAQFLNTQVPPLSRLSRQNNNGSREGNFHHVDSTDDKNQAFGWRTGGALPLGLDSVLNQSSLHHHHYNPGGSHNVPTVLQPMWPPCLGPTSIHTPGPYGPYWPDGAFEPYRPAPLLDPRFQIRATTHATDLSAQLQPAVDNYGQWLQAHSDSQYARGTDHSIPPGPVCERETEDLGSPMSGLDLSSMRNSLFYNQSQGTAQKQLDAPLEHRNKPSIWKEQSVQTLNDIYSERGAAYSLQIPDHSIDNSEFKEKVLVWAHRIYSTLLASIEEARRHSPNGSHYPSGLYLQPPRRPYPSWSSHQSRANRLHHSIKSPTRTPADDHGCDTDNRSRHRNHHTKDFPEVRTTEARSLRTHSSSLSTGQTRQRWQSRDDSIGSSHQLTQQPSYVPPQLAVDRHTNSPSAAAAYAMEMLGKLCQESGFKWTDGMLLTGCLAYGLSDYNKAMKWYWKILHQDPDNVEAMSNLAATLLALNRREDAEQYWLRSVKLRPSYFEAIEHLVGLLHEGHRGREAVKVIEYVEHALRLDPGAILREQKHEGAGDYGFGHHSTYLSADTDQVATGGFRTSGYAISPSDNGRMLALVHGKGNMLYQLGDNTGAAQAFEDAILIGAGRRHLGIQGLIKRILAVFSEHPPMGPANTHPQFLADEPILLPPNMALETSRLVFPPQGRLPGLDMVPDGFGQKAAVSIISNSLLSLAKIYQDGMSSSGAAATAPRATSGVQEILALYYLSLSLQPSPSTANNVGILLASVQQSARAKSNNKVNNPQTSNIPGVVPGSGTALALAYYDYGLKLDTRHAHLYTNLGSLFKDIGQLNAAIKMYEKAVDCDGGFDIALANLANAVKDQGKVSDAITYYKRAVQSNPDFAEAVCGLANALNSVCKWSGRGGINQLGNNRDRWHVDENGDLYDSKKSLIESHGWIARVVTIVEKQLRDGESWGQGVLHSVGIGQMLQQLGVASSLLGGNKNIQILLRNTLNEWAEKQWEGAKVVRLVERATKNLSQILYRYQYVDKRPIPASLRSRPQLPAALAVPSAPTVLPFHTFTCPLSAKQIRKISQRNGLRVSCSTLRAPWLSAEVFDPPPPPNPHLNVGYISSDFNNHPLAHLMQSVFGFHDRNYVKAFCYATTTSDGSVHRQQIEREAPVFHDASSWSIDHLVSRVVADGIHILVNLNGYTRGARNEVFAARPAPIQMSFMGFAGTLGAEWCDYLLADETAIPSQTLRPWRGNVDLIDQTKDGNNDNDQDDWVYGENIIFTKNTFFCCDHRQSAPDSHEPHISWPEEQQRRWQMRKELFPYLDDSCVILGNFNQLYKIEPTTFRTWLRILSRVPKAVLWLLRFPDLGEENLRETALRWVGVEVASRIIFTDVAPKHQHISRARVCDLFLDTPECNAHTTAADVLWSGTPLLTFPRYEYKMCSRMAASILKGALPKNSEGVRAAEDLIANSDEAYEEQGVELGSDLVYSTQEGQQGMGKGRLMELRKLLYESRWTSALFDTRRWVRDLETAYLESWRRWVAGEGGDIWL